MESRNFADLFPRGLDYLLKKIVEATISESVSAEQADVNLGYVLEGIEKLKASLLEEEGVELFNERWEFEFRHLAYSLAELRTYFRNPDEPHINQEEAFIFAYFVDKYVRKLKDRVKSGDEHRSESSDVW
jgi:hypothetical protein